jgi:hypothetical protein
MITTVTTATLSAGAITTALSIVVTLMLIMLIGLRELAIVVGPRSRMLARLLVVAIAPFVVVFAVSVVKHLAALV